MFNNPEPSDCRPLQQQPPPPPQSQPQPQQNQQPQQQQQHQPQPHQSSPIPEPQLPRGECAFILADTDPQTGTRQRCTCRSFYPDHVVRSRCGCGHQAWHHEAQPLSSVSMDEYMALTEEVKALKNELKRFARLKHDLAQERLRREELKHAWNMLHQRQYQVMRDLKLHIDDKVEAVVDKSQDIADSLKTLHAKMMTVEDTNFDLENRVDKLEHARGFQSRSLTPVVENNLEHTIEKPMILDTPIVLTHQLPIRTEKKLPQSWTVKVVFLPTKTQTHAFEYDSVGTKRCQSRNLLQDITFSGPDCSTFIATIEANFKHALRGRSWVPLTGYRPEDEPYGRITLKQLPIHLTAKATWDYAFIDQECVVHDKMQGDLLHIALENETLSWADIRWLPAVPNADESCWAHDEELDGNRPFGFKSLDSELMYDYLEPPPYSSRTHSDMDRLPSRLDLLAQASSMQSLVDSAPPSASLRAAYSDVRSLSEKSMSDLSFSERSISTMDLSDDEHRDKKLRMKGSVASLQHHPPGSSAGPSSMYVSGRSKRKMPTNGKLKEPVHWGVDSLARPLHGFRKNRAAVKEKAESVQS